MIQRCRCTTPFAVNSIGPEDTAGLIVSDMHCDGCGYPLDNDDRRIPMIQRVGLELWKYYAAQEQEWAQLDKLIFSRHPEMPLQRIYRSQLWLSGYGIALSLFMVVVGVMTILGWGPVWLHSFCSGFGLGTLGVLLWLTHRQNKRLRTIQRRLEGSS